MLGHPNEVRASHLFAYAASRAPLPTDISFPEILPSDCLFSPFRYTAHKPKRGSGYDWLRLGTLTRGGRCALPLRPFWVLGRRTRIGPRRKPRFRPELPRRAQGRRAAKSRGG